MYCVWPPYIFRPTTRFAYCTVILRTPCVTAMTAAITMNKKRDHQDENRRIDLARAGLRRGNECLPRLRQRRGQARHDADRDDQRDTVADPALGDLIAQPHQEQRARRSA